MRWWSFSEIPNLRIPKYRTPVLKLQILCLKYRTFYARIIKYRIPLKIQDTKLSYRKCYVMSGMYAKVILLVYIAWKHCCLLLYDDRPLAIAIRFVMLFSFSPCWWDSRIRLFAFKNTEFSHGNRAYNIYISRIYIRAKYIEHCIVNKRYHCHLVICN